MALFSRARAGRTERLAGKLFREMLGLMPS
jgi:hypothetical protein